MACLQQISKQWFASTAQRERDHLVFAPFSYAKEDKESSFVLLCRAPLRVTGVS